MKNGKSSAFKTKLYFTYIIDLRYVPICFNFIKPYYQTFIKKNMIYGENFVFGHLQKTGGTYVAKQLKQAFPKSKKYIKKHESLKVFISKKDYKPIVLGSIRNPLELYVSLWAYGCQKKGSLYNSFTSPTMTQILLKIILLIKILKKGYYSYIKHIKFNNSKKWRALYKDSNNVEDFREWFSRINSKQFFF